jgi:hypothetical protein
MLRFDIHKLDVVRVDGIASQVSKTGVDVKGKSRQGGQRWK